MDIDFIQKLIDNCEAPRIEIGGPSPREFEFLQEIGISLPNNIIVTNISNPVILNPFGDEPEEHSVDAVVDVRKLPYEKSSVGMLLTSSLPHKLHKSLFEESARVLRPKGILIIENQQDEDEPVAIKNGLAPLLEPKVSKKLYSQIYIKS